MDDIKTRFVAFGLPRSGTTFLIRLLDSHQQILCMEEILQPVSSTCHTVYPIPRYQLYREQSAYKQLISKLARDYALRQYLDWIFENYRNEAVGFKLMLSQLQEFPYVGEYMQKGQFKVIHIVRENLLKLHVSQVRARLTDVWVSKKPVAQTQVNIPVRELLNNLQDLENQQQSQAQLIRQMQLPHIELVYEKLAQDYSQALLPVLDFLGVDKEIKLNTEVRKITSDDLSQVIENYQEVTNTLASTKYEQLLA
jgi:hypothetical protein